MDSETRPQVEGEQAPEVFDHNFAGETALAREIGEPPVEPYRGLRWIFIGEQGLRSGWSLVLFSMLLMLFMMGIGYLFNLAHLFGPRGQVAARALFFNELVPFLSMLAAAAIVGLVERRRILDYNLTGPNRSRHFLTGLGMGFVALSALVGLLAAGGWLQFGAAALTGAAIFKFAFEWGCVFLLVGCVEEGLFRCYLQFTLTRGVNFWWALSAVAVMCIDLIWRVRGNGVWGVYAAALMGLVPCLYLYLKSGTGRDGFWQAAWVTSTLFGFIHTSNNGENWIGIFSAAAIGFIFCLSIRVTGSAWWAIGFHASWDWAETYFYGTADSGLTAQGHYLSATPAGNPFWSGGTDGPEGSVLILGVLALLLAGLVVASWRKSITEVAIAALGEVSA